MSVSHTYHNQIPITFHVAPACSYHWKRSLTMISSSCLGDGLDVILDNCTGFNTPCLPPCFESTLVQRAVEPYSQLLKNSNKIHKLKHTYAFLPCFLSTMVLGVVKSCSLIYVDSEKCTGWSTPILADHASKHGCA